MHAGPTLPLRVLPALALAALLPAQIPLPSARWIHDPAPEEPAGVARRLGDERLAAGDPRGAAEHYERALELHGGSRELRLAMLRAAQADPDARALWSQALVDRLADVSGRIKPERALQELLGPHAADAQRIAAARAAAAAELLKFADKRKAKGQGALGNDAVARWAMATAAPLLLESAALHEALHAPFRESVARHEPDHATVITALKQLLEQATAARVGPKPAAATTGPDPADLALRAARCLTGLAAQARFEDLEGPAAPDLSDLARSARQARQKLRERPDGDGGPAAPLTIAELEAMTPDQQLEFTRRHARWSEPGVAISPNGRYVVETTCGHETLLGVARTVELHHARLANWYGKDPFTTQQGLVRIVPDADDLEAEDAPFWWAGGFQSGHVTHLQFHWGTIEGLGHGLTHELTHRFDGTLLPFLPSWLVEGRAVWTGKAYGKSSDESFVELHFDLHAASGTYVKGYGSEAELRKLIEGTIEDYRDNYTAGYSLFAFLKTWPIDGEPRFAAALDKFQRSARAGQNARFEHFERHFCDGKQGRPAGFAAFVPLFHDFLRGCYDYSWGEKDKAPWVARYPGVEGGSSPLVLDEETFTWSRQRAEPWFGQDHARRAGRLLAEAGKAAPAAAALLWSIRTDEWSPSDMRLLAELLAGLRLPDAAWAIRHENDRLAPGADDPPAAAPFLDELPRTRALLALLAAGAGAHRTAGRNHAANVTTAMHDRLALALGLPGLPAGEPTSNPFWPHPARSFALGRFGWIEDGLTGYEERRVRDLWFEDGTDLHVGRSRPRDETGLLDRAAHQRHAFVRTQESFRAGHYVLRTRVHFTTSFVSGAVVLGLQRRDRNLRVHFSAGNFLYAIGRSEDPGKTDQVALRVDGLHAREDHLPGSQRHYDVDFDQPSSWFDLELHVVGPCLHVHANGTHCFSYATPDGTPIEGAIGFAMGQGAIRLQQPTVQVLAETVGGAEAAGLARFGIDLLAPEPRDLVQLLLRPVRDLPPSETGTILLWLPAGTTAEQLPRLVERYVEGFGAAIQNADEYPQQWLLAVPAGLEPKARAAAAAALGALQSRIRIVEHQRAQPFVEDARLVFVDGHSILRTAQKTRPKAGLVGGVRDWARRWRQTTATK